jgi:Ca2+-binding RTX toxin-like protein
MADLTLSNSFLTFDALPDWNWSRSGVTNNGITYSNGSQQTITLTGTFNATTGDSISGKISEVTLTQGGNQVFKIAGLDLDAATLANLVDNVSDARQAFAYLLGGNDTINGTAMRDQLYGYAGNDTIQAGGGDDLVVGGPGNDSIDGGAGIDIVRYSGSIADFKIERTSDGGVSITDLKGDNGVDVLHNVETVEFADKVFLPVDVNGASGQVFRLYQAALDRLPDPAGMNYWQAQMANGGKLDSISQAFIQSAEYQKLYGTGHTNAELVGEYYQHILGRAGEKAGIDFWAGVLDSHAATGAQVLAAISDSPENVQHSVALIGNGLVLDAPIMTI